MECRSQPLGRFIPPHRTNTDNFAGASSYDSQNQTTVFNGKEKGRNQPRNTSIQTSPGEPVLTGITGGTQTTPPASPRRSTSTGGTQTTPACNTQGQQDCNHHREDPQAHNLHVNKGKGKKSSKKKSAQEAPPCPSTSTGVVPRTDFQSRNLSTGRPSIQCTACGEYSHWRRECPYNNFCTTCNNHNHATHMCRAPRQTPKQSPVICLYCGSSEHSSAQCHNTRHQPCEEVRSQEFQWSNGKISRNTEANPQGQAGHQHFLQSHSEISGNSGSYHPNNASSHYFRGSQSYSNDQQ